MTDLAWLESLEGTSHLRTAPRRVLAELIAERAGGFTAADLLADPRARQRGIGRATVFRTLELLHSFGLLERLELPDGEHTYVRCEPQHHHHVICSACGRAADVEGCALSAFTAEVGRRSGYRIDRHRVEFFGLCPACQSGARPTSGASDASAAFAAPTLSAASAARRRLD